MKIVIESIPHAEQRYPTCGDYRRDSDGTLHIKVSELPDNRYMLLVAIHELIEQVLSEQAGITNEQIDAFDFAYEAKRQAGDDSEPGDSIDCPVYKQHQFATGIEKILAAELGVDWVEYEKCVNALGSDA
jgi:hypothetical protein